MKKIYPIKLSFRLFAGLLFLSVSCSQHSGESSKTNGEEYFRDLYSDTWVATDALGRTMPDIDSVGDVKTDQRRVVGMFYITWHTADRANRKSPYRADVSWILNQDPTARLDADHPLWTERGYHWGEPEMGYFLSQDKYVIRKDMSMLTDAGVDVLVMDVTNARHYWDEWRVLFTTMQEMKAEGNKVPQFIFWAFNGPTISVVQALYDSIYKPGKYQDLWFYWDDKPLLLYNGKPHDQPKATNNKNSHYDPAAKTDTSHPHYGDPDYTEEFYLDYTKEVKAFFTLRTMWWGNYEWRGERFIGTEDNWCFGYNLADKRVRDMDLADLLSTHNGIREEAAVTPAQHAHTMVGKSWTRENGEPELNEYDLPVPTYVPWLGDTVENPEGYGIYFQDRWEETLPANPQFLYLNDWNEWTAGKYAPRNGKEYVGFMRRKNSKYYFVDQYNSEFTRCIQPMKGGFSDNYYMQMAQNLRRFKGVRPIPRLKGYSRVKVDGKFRDWKGVTTEYRDTYGDTYHRDHPGYGGLQYRDSSGRNDILTAKVAVDETFIYYYAQTRDALTPHTGDNWMLLLIDADNDSGTGWYGYDFLVNGNVEDAMTTSLMRYDANNPENPWRDMGSLTYQYHGNELEIQVPRTMIDLTGAAFTFDFKWSDNAAALEDPISLCLHGDTAPNRRFNYRCIWSK